MRGQPSIDLRAHDRAVSLDSATAFARLVDEQPGAPSARVWVPEREGLGPRVYVGTAGYVTVSRFDIAGHSLAPGRRASSITLSLAALYPPQRRAVLAAMRRYRETYAPAAMEREAALVRRAWEARLARVYAAVERGASTLRAIADETGYELLDAHQIVTALKERGDVHVRGLGTDRERIQA